MVLDIFISIFTEVIKEPIMEFVVVPIKRHISYPFTYKSKVEKLHHEAGKLKNRTVKLQQAVEEATRKGEEIYESVNKWLIDAGKAIEEAEECIQGEEQAKKRCFVGLCPDLKTRYQLSKKAEKKALAIHELANEGDLDSISFRPPLQQIVAPSVYAREGLNSRELFLEKVMDALLDPDLNMIGVYGLGGVGKTTLAKQVHRKAIEENLFDVVAMVAVNQTPELRRIQSEIADILGLKFDVEEIPGRANRLYERLKKELEKEKKVFIILDDIWKKLDLNAVGIPFGDVFKGCKILLTSRSQDVLSREMGTQKEFKLDVLQDEEARSLFEITVAGAKDSELPPIAAEIAKKCAGLPLLLLTVATDLRNRELYAWSDKLNQLSEFDNEEIYSKVHAILESSYNNLCSNEVKSFFLLCGLLGQSNIEIQSLLKYIVGLSLFKNISTVQGARNKVYSLIDTLKAQSLLLDGDMYGFVKIHDVVRDTALNIASREQHAFIVTSGMELVKFPNKDCTRISLPYCDIENLPEGWECPKAEALFLFTEVFCLGIPHQFFKGIRNLEVVDFTGIHFVSLPSSLAFLSNLHTLCLHRCQLDDLAIIGDLKQLRVLSFANSYVVELPRQIEQLARLKVLDVSNCSKLKMIPANALSKLSELEELYMSNSFVEWEADGNNASLAELEKLSQLTTSEMHILDDKILPKHLFSNGRLQTFRILIGDNWDWDDNYKTSRALKLKLKASIHSGYGIKVLLRETEDLCLDESLILENLMKLEKIYHGRLAAGSFNKLEILQVKNCQRLTHLFSLSAVKCLLQLQEMKVEDCPQMKAIVIDESESSNEVFEFNGLRSLNLRNLPNLRTFHSPLKIEEFLSERDDTTHLSFFSRTVSFPNLEHLELHLISCEKIWHNQFSATSSKLERLSVIRCNELKYLFTTSIVKKLLQLKTLDMSDCSSMEEIILPEEFVEEKDERMNQILFPKLDKLTLWDLPKLIRFCTGYQIEFQSLRELNISKCYALMCLVPSVPHTGRMEKQNDTEMNQNQNQNQNAEIQSLFNRMVSFPNLERLSLFRINKLKRIWHSPLAANSFFKLKSLYVYDCHKLMVIFPSNVLERFRRMEELDVTNCVSLQEIYQLEEFNVDEAFELRRLNIHGLRSLKHVWRKDPQGVFNFQNLKSVEVLHCYVLNYLFPASIAEGLLQLEELTITWSGVVEIIAKAKDVEQASCYCFKFPQLTSLQLIYLSELRSWYSGTHIFECQKLTSLDVRNCYKITKFSSQEIQEESIQPLLFLEKMSPNLEELTLEHKDLIAIQQGQFFSKLKMLTFTNLQNKSRPFIIGFLERLYSVETILVEGHNTSKELFSYEGLAGEDEEHPRTLARVKNLKLQSVYNLKHIWDPDSALKPLLQYLETLTVFDCDSLINIAPSSSSFQNLATLEVSYCAGLTNLITASTAKSMVQLTKMTVRRCKMMTEIVTSDGDDHTEDEIINFDKLKCLELDYLPGLISFCSGNNAFNFPALENVTVNECSRMKIFAFGDLNTPKLRGILLGDQQRWEGNLNATLAEMTFCKYFKASEFPELWHDGMQGRLLRNVERLEVDKCAMYNKAIPSNVLVFLNKLEELEVKDCDSADEVFDLEGVSADDGLLPRLKKLQLTSLPMLRHLWIKDPIGIFEFKNLKWLHVGNCSSLRYIFTWSMALCLLQLEKIEIYNCKMIEVIIEMEEAADKMILLPSLKSVVLKYLPRFVKLCSGWSNVECPLLEEMSIHECPSLKNIFATQTPVNTIDEFHTSFLRKMFPNLKKFSLDKKSTITILGFQFPTGFFSKVKVLELSFFLNKYHVPLFSLLPIFSNLERLEVLDSSLDKLLPFEGLGGDQEDITTIPQIRDLKLYNVHDLKHIWNPDGQLHEPLFQSLETFEIEFCGNLIVLAPSSVSLGNLKTLKVYGCNTLANIFTSAAAKSMVQLKTLIVRSCNMLTAIIGGVQEDGSTDEIVFSKMKTLELEDLQNLKCFCLGSYTFKFPSLEQVDVFRCPKLRIFTVHQLSAPKIHGVFTGNRFKRTFHWEGDLNATIEQIYMKYIGFKGIYDIQLSNFPMLKEKWHGQFPFENLEYLRKLMVDQCAFFSIAISSNLLKRLSWLNKLAVERCDSMEELFELEWLNADEGDVGLLESLEELRLIDLPRLVHVWNKDPQGILSFRNLTLLKVENCSSLTNIFTLSMASGLIKLKHLELKRCNLVEHIITKEAEEEIAKDNTIFPSMESMSLECLPNLLSFYSASDVLKCPSLKRIEIVGCPNMELLASKFCKEHDLSMIAEGNGERIAASSGGKVFIPSLEELGVECNTIKDLCSQTSQADFLCGLKGIELTCISSDSTLLPSQFFESLPILEKFVLSDASFEDIIFCEEIIGEEIHPQSLVKLKELSLSKLPRLKHLRDAKLLSVFQSLETLNVMECGRLQVLVASSVSFQNLTTLQVSNCQGLVNLLSSSTARSLERLEKMKIEECELIQEVIVAEVDKEEEENEICFNQLKCLELRRLPSLSSFCSGNLTFNFPSLEEVILVKCPNMKIFAQEVSTPQLWRVQTGEQRKYDKKWKNNIWCWGWEYTIQVICDWEWEGSLNNTIEALFKEKKAEETGIGQCSYG
uniref:AAA+ ATPase domain-containing protein n=1 Tax=Manihot esculenta TaxID=3983 RepID=A0A2C9VJ07_MANES